ncbi:benzaldehyde dehydrogenase [Sphingomonas sp. 4RDLI-65]|uniref:benzaldehyde dehydrogenase n=1 Tax=Sphingomonas sp. 4RDLI-65 TaxID=3111641 RepID=UPI003C23FE6D
MTDGTQLIGDAQLDGSIFDGGWSRPADSADVIEPASGAVLGRIGMTTPAGIATAAAAARAAQRDWAADAPDARAAIFPKAVRVATERWDEIVEWIMRESGSVRAKAEFELSITIKALNLAGAMPHQAQGLVLPSERGRISLARRRPLGVVGVISPFNFPLYLAMRAVAPAIAVGNAVVLKPDPRTAICGGFVIARLFELAGLPAGVLHVLPGRGDAGEALCSDANIAMIQFTGSTAAGRMVGRTASENLKKVSLELGGKNSLIVLEDADLDLAARNASWASYLHQGQICMSAGRILVQSTIAEDFAKRLAQHADALPVGDPMSGQVAVGPIINQTQVDHARKLLDSSVSAGASIAAGGTSDGLFFKPTVLTGVTKDMPAFREEIFGPVAVIVPFETDDEAVALANDTEYGLSAGILTRDVGRGMAIGDRLHAGLVHINDQTVNDDVVNPFGGVGASGNGSSIGGPANWEEFTHWQWTTIKGTPPAYPF